MNLIILSTFQQEIIINHLPQSDAPLYDMTINMTQLEYHIKLPRRDRNTFLLTRQCDFVGELFILMRLHPLLQTPVDYQVVHEGWTIVHLHLYLFEVPIIHMMIACLPVRILLPC